MTDHKKGLLAKELRGTRLFAGPEGAAIRCVSQDGEVRWELGQMPGRYYADEYTAYMGRGDRLQVNGGSFVRPGGGSLGRMEAMSFGDKAYQSGANPDWVAPVRTIEEREQAMLVRLTKKMNRQFDAREKALRAAVQIEKQSTVIEKESGDGETPEATDQQEQAQQASNPQGHDETGQVQLQKEGVKSDE